MSVVMDIYGLIRDLMTEAEKVKDDKLYSSLIDCAYESAKCRDASKGNIHS